MADRIQTAAWNNSMQHMEKLYEQDFQREISLFSQLGHVIWKLSDSDTGESKSRVEEDYIVYIFAVKTD